MYKHIFIVVKLKNINLYNKNIYDKIVFQIDVEQTKGKRGPTSIYTWGLS